MISNIYKSNKAIWKAGERQNKSKAFIEKQEALKLKKKKMAYISKEEFEAKVAEDFKNLDKEKFEILLHSVKIRLKQLIQTGDLTVTLDNTISTNPNYKFIFEIFGTVFKTKRISLKQYKALKAFIKSNPYNEDNEEYKQF